MIMKQIPKQALGSIIKNLKQVEAPVKSVVESEEVSECPSHYRVHSGAKARAPTLSKRSSIRAY